MGEQRLCDGFTVFFMAGKLERRVCWAVHKTACMLSFPLLCHHNQF